MLPYLQDTGRMYSISNPQEVSGLAKLDFLSEPSASDGAKKHKEAPPFSKLCLYPGEHHASVSLHMLTLVEGREEAG